MTFERPTLPEGEKDYSSEHDPIYCALEINYAHGEITKIGHITAILDAHFPNVHQLYETMDGIKRACVKSRSPLAKRILTLLAEVQP